MRQANPSTQANGRYTFGSGSRPLDGYTIKRAIGRGGFGEVYYATSDSGKEVALKLILRNLDVERRGVSQCMNLKCPNLLAIHDLKENDAGDAFVVMEYVAGPSLANVLKQYPNGMPPAEVRHWLKGLVEGVAYLHDHGIVHRDLKPANLFMEEGIVKIGDYGLAKLITPSQGTEHSESIGTCHYMAPEIGSGKYNKPIDVYAIGVILYEMLTGRVPFDGETVNEVLMKHLTARPDVSMLLEPYRTIVARALAKDPNARQARVYDLLPPGDVPREPEVRIIGDKAGGFGAKAAPPEDDVLRIEAEEPVFYIGPDTRPPRRQGPTLAQRVRATWQDMRRELREAHRQERKAMRDAARNGGAAIPASYQRRAPQPQPPPQPPPRRPAPVRRAIAPAPVATPPPPPPEPVAMPSGRVRFAELAASMLWSAPLLALLALPAAAALEIDPSQRPQQAAFLYIMALLGTWTALIPGKVLETRRLDWGGRHLIAAAAGWLTGFAGLHLARALRLDLSPQPDFFDNPNGLMPYYFAALYAIMAGWWARTARDRPSRFRIRTVLWTGLVAAALIPLWPYQRQDDIALAAMIATAVQLVSPWNEAASAYARYVKATRKQKPRRRVA
jgi:hypothetical protein